MDTTKKISTNRDSVEINNLRIRYQLPGQMYAGYIEYDEDVHFWKSLTGCWNYKYIIF